MLKLVRCTDNCLVNDIVCSNPKAPDYLTDEFVPRHFLLLVLMWCMECSLYLFYCKLCHSSHEVPN